jgi:hypothetical protein
VMKVLPRFWPGGGAPDFALVFADAFAEILILVPPRAIAQLIAARAQSAINQARKLAAVAA